MKKALWTGLFLWMSAFSAFSLTLTVSPKGDDAAVEGKPLATMDGARRRIRALRAAGMVGSNEWVEVEFRSGEYAITNPVTFTPEDSYVRYRAGKDQIVTIFGGRRLPLFREEHGGLWQTRIPQGRSFEQLYVDGTRVQRAKTPNEFYFYMREPIPFGVDPVTGKRDVNLSYRAFRGRPEDLEVLRGKSADDLSNVVLRVFHSWEVSQSRLQAVDVEKGLVVGTAASRWPYFHWKKYLPRYVLENIREAMDLPGEWFADPVTGLLSYLPRKGERVGATYGIAPVSEGFLRITGDALAKQWVRDLTFEGIRFLYSGYWLPPQGQGDGQASIGQPAAIEVNGAERIRFLSCEVAHTGAHGIWFRKGVRHSEIRQCEIHDLGGGAVYIGDTQWSKAELPNALTGFNVVENSILQDGGHVLPGSIGVWIGHASDNQITHNDISDFFYTGVSMGWTWGYRETVSKRNELSFNHIHHLGKGVLNDMGAVYTLGASEGTVVTNNHIHDVWSYDYSGRGGWGLYTDEGSAGIVFENNLVHHVKTGCVHQHYGKGNIFRNNIFADSLYGQIQRSRIEDHRTIIVTNNVIYWGNDTAAVWRGYSSPSTVKIDDMVFDYNLYWNPQGVTNAAFMGRTWDEWREQGQDFHSMRVDPEFVQPEVGDYRVKRNSPAKRAGYFMLDPETVGVYGDAAWRRKAVRSHQRVRFAPVPERFSISRYQTGFEEIAVGEKLPLAGTLTEKKGDSIVVVEGVARSGNRSLCFTDAPGLKYTFNPHLTLSSVYTNGKVNLRFAVRLQETSDFIVEWRDHTHPTATHYSVGGVVHFRKGKVFVRHGVKQEDGNWGQQEEQIAAVGKGQWVDVQVSHDLAQPDGGAWSVCVSPKGGQAVTREGLLACSSAFRFFEWCGFVSQATVKTRVWLDDLSLEQEK